MSSATATTYGPLASIEFDAPQQALAELVAQRCSPDQYTAWCADRDDYLKAAAVRASRGSATLTTRVAKSGGVSVYGLGRWPVTLYAEQWHRLATHMPAVLAYITANKSQLKAKGDPKRETAPAEITTVG